MKMLNNIKKITKALALATVALGLSTCPALAKPNTNSYNTQFPTSVNAELQAQLQQKIAERGLQAVSYTHLTLPTIHLV